MKYMNCPSCSAQNRATDEKCYSCQGPLAAPAPEVEAPVDAVAANNARLARASGGVVTGRNMDRSSTWKDGLRSGLIAGVVTGILWGLYIGFFGAAIAGPGVAFQVFLTVLGSEIFFCCLIGGLCGALDVLCYKYDCIKIGSVIGVIWAIKNFNLYQLMTGGIYGSAMALLCSHIEKVKRGQYSEF